MKIELFLMSSSYHTLKKHTLNAIVNDKRYLSTYKIMDPIEKQLLRNVFVIYC